MLSAYYTLRLLEAAGLPPGVINFVPGDPVMVSKVALDSPELAGIHFTGSTAVFQSHVEARRRQHRHYRCYPRLVGETGGKDFIVAHPSADPQEVAVALVRGGFEYQGQKCSAASRVYVPQSLWTEVRDRAIAMMREITMGDPRDFRNFMGAVIDQKAFTKITRLHRPRPPECAACCRAAAAAVSRAGSSSRPWSRPSDPGYRLLCEEIFGPVVTAYAYPDAKWHETLAVVDQTSPYALTGSVFARDRARHPRGLGGAAPRRRQLLRQRQADRRHRRASSRSAAPVRRAPTTRPARR